MQNAERNIVHKSEKMRNGILKLHVNRRSRMRIARSSEELNGTNNTIQHGIQDEKVECISFIKLGNCNIVQKRGILKARCCRIWRLVLHPNSECN